MNVGAYLKGAGDAHEVFGVKQASPNATPKPPPTWAHGKKVTIPSMTERSMVKEAVSPEWITQLLYGMGDKVRRAGGSRPLAERLLTKPYGAMSSRPKPTVPQALQARPTSVPAVAAQSRVDHLMANRDALGDGVGILRSMANPNLSGDHRNSYMSDFKLKHPNVR